MLYGNGFTLATAKERKWKDTHEALCMFNTRSLWFVDLKFRLKAELHWVCVMPGTPCITHNNNKHCEKAPLEMLYPDTGMISIFPVTQIYTLSNERTLIYTSCSTLFRKISINFVSRSLSEQVHKLTSCSKLSRASQDFYKVTRSE